MRINNSINFKYKIFVVAILAIFGILFFSFTPVEAADYYQVDPGATVEVDEHTVCRMVVCRMVTNNGSLTVFVPTKTSSEWAGFRLHYPSSVSLGGCCTPNSSKSCYDGDVYWYDSCGNREEPKYQECYSDSWTNNYNCSGTWRTRQVRRRGCSGSSCYDYYEWINIENCANYGQVCQGGSCVSSCTSHSYRSCYNNDVYWYDSCNNREEKYQECYSDSWTNNYRCSGNWRQRQKRKRGCSSSSCHDYYQWENYQYCPNSGQICQNGSCVSSLPSCVSILNSATDHDCNYVCFYDGGGKACKAISLQIGSSCSGGDWAGYYVWFNGQFYSGGSCNTVMQKGYTYANPLNPCSPILTMWTYCRCQ